MLIYLHTYIPARHAMIPAAGHGLHVYGLTMPLVTPCGSGSEEKVVRREAGFYICTHCDVCRAVRLSMHSMLHGILYIVYAARVTAQGYAATSAVAYTSLDPLP